MCPDSGRKRLSIATNSLHWSLSELSSPLIENKYTLSSITLVWQVLEASCTCTIADLSDLNCVSYALIGDTHHLRYPISSLTGYLLRSKFSAIFCTQSHHAFFFKELTGIPAYSFPYTNPIYPAPSLPNKIQNSVLYAGSPLSLNHLERSRVVNYGLANGIVDLVPRMPWCKWLDFLATNCNRLIAWSLNSNFSPQVLYPLLYGNILYTDHISPANWLGKLLIENNLCYIADNAKELLQLIRQSSAQNSLVHSDIINPEIVMMRNAMELIKSRLNRLPDVQEVILNSKLCLTSLNSFSTDAGDELAKVYTFNAKKYGLETAYRLLHIYENLQLVTSRFSKVTVILDDTSITPDMLQFIKAFPLMLTRLNICNPRCITSSGVSHKAIKLSALIP